ncbi:MAG: aminotransferase class V-fold PLP-dependent enzyme, partial [Ignavibacteria bacterium]|nr:aminotransferase class V-fold PLP-dependent enzyme [Ignavibacteria bacterium]
MIKFPIYLDNHSTTQLDARVLDEMLPFFIENFGNPASSQHAYGWKAESAVNMSRTKIAELIGASPEEIIFT